jgi:hypothetical protein
MKKLIMLLVILLPLAVAAPGHCFFDWLFSGGASKDAIDNSALGDLRAWWTGNPGYVFNPWWSGPSNPQAQGSSGASYGPQAPYPQMPQPNISYSPPQGQPPTGYGQPMQQPMPQAMQPGYGGGMAAAGQQYQMPAQGYQPMPQYQPTPQYQAAPQTYQPPQGYQAAPQMMQQPVPQQGYPGVAGAPQMAPQGNYRQ